MLIGTRRLRAPRTVLTLAAVALLGACGGGTKVAPSPTPTATSSQPVATATISPGPTATLTPAGTTILGLRVEQFVVAEPVPVPEHGVLYVGTGCYGCDGSGRKPWRIYADPATGSALMEPLSIPGDGHPWQFLGDTDGMLYLLVCNPDCPALAGNEDAISHIYRSADGGFSWDLLDSFEGYARIVATDGARVVVDWYWRPGRRDEDPVERYLLPGREFVGEVQPQEADGSLITLGDGSQVRVSPRGDSLLDAEGRTVWQPTPDEATQYLAPRGIAIWPGRDERTVRWEGASLSSTPVYLAYYLGTAIQRVFEANNDLSVHRINAWLDIGMGIGTGFMTATQMGSN